MRRRGASALPALPAAAAAAEGAPPVAAAVLQDLFVLLPLGLVQEPLHLLDRGVHLPLPLLAELRRFRRILRLDVIILGLLLGREQPVDRVVPRLLQRLAVLVD